MSTWIVSFKDHNQGSGAGDRGYEFLFGPFASKKEACEWATREMAVLLKRYPDAFLIEETHFRFLKGGKDEVEFEFWIIDLMDPNQHHDLEDL